MKGKSKAIKAIILAAGFSKRINLEAPKQLVKVAHKPLIAYTLDVFERHQAIDSIVLVAPRKHILKFNNLVKSYGYKKIEQLCLGGRTRQQSVFNALRKIRVCDYVIIHDGVRPFVSPEVISRLIQAVKRFGAATCAVEAIDTIVQAKDGFVSQVLKREKIWRIQTPQAFRFNLIYQAHQKAQHRGIANSSDDAQIVLKLGNKVRLVQGDYKNLKITTPGDLDLAKKLFKK